MPTFFARIAIALFVAVVGVAPLRAADHDYVLHRAVSQKIEASYKFEIRLPHLAAKDWVIFAAQAPTTAAQQNVSSRLLPNGTPYEELSDRHRALFRARLAPSSEEWKHSFKGEAQYRATLYSRRLVERSPGEPAPEVRGPSDAERRHSLAETESLDFSSDAFRAWLKKHRLHERRKENDVDFARRAFLAITRSMTYDYQTKMDRHASHLCEVDSADCGGMCVLFVSALRANEIPARLLFGRWAKSSKTDAKLNGVAYVQQHVKAEFFVDDLGWVPVDLSSAVLHDKTAAGLQYFGHDRGDFLVTHLDPDMQVDSVHFGVKPIRSLQGFSYFVTGTGKLDDESMTTEWQVKVVE
jgi:transglutaminase-like putative cysteine protease